MEDTEPSSPGSRSIANQFFFVSKPLHNYLRTFRRGAGLTQKEVAYLLSGPSPSQVSRLERSKSEPNLRTLLALELLFHTPGRRLFAGVHDEVDHAVAGRAKRLLKRIDRGAGTARLDRKRETLRTLVESHGDVLDLPV